MNKKKIRHIIFGGAGFIGINLTRYLLKENSNILVIDNLSNSRFDVLQKLTKSHYVFFEELNINDKNSLSKLAKSYDFEESCICWHLAANSDISKGIDDISIDLDNTFMTTISVLEFCKDYEIKSFVFSSSSAIYGDHLGKALDENYGPLIPISNYGAMKLASEAVISASYGKFLNKAIIFRFPNVIGYPATHGVIHDFINKLGKNPEKLQVLGNGKQQKTYLHAEELVKILCSVINKLSGLEVINIGPCDDGIKVSQIAELVTENFSPNAKIEYPK